MTATTEALCAPYAQHHARDLSEPVPQRPVAARLRGVEKSFGPHVVLRGIEVTLPPWLHGVATLMVDELDDTAWAHGAAGVALRVLYGAPWGATGPVALNSPARIEAINA